MDGADMEQNIPKRQGLNTNALKAIAIVAMTIDHLAWTFFPGYRIDVITLFMHIIGRLTAPIMIFFIVEGYFRTRNIKKYIRRMFVFAFISHFAYALMFDKNFIPFQNGVFDQTSVMWTFALGLTALAVSQSDNPKLKQWHRHVLISFCLIAAFPADWSTPAAASILYMGQNRGNFKRQTLWFMTWIACYSVVYAIFLNPVYGLLQMFVALAIPLWRMYNGERGKWKGMKWFFYFYYPVHLTVLGLVRIFILH
jgi:hypothetical protein